jgi:hypothetical protein
MQVHKMNKYLMPLIALIIFIPDFIMLYALGNLIINDTIFYIVVIFSVEIVLSKFMKGYGIFIILLTAMIILLFYLKTLLKYSNIVKTYFYYIPDMPVSYKLVLTALVIIAIAMLIEGLFTKNFWHLISYYITVSGIMLMQMATIAYMKKTGITVNIISYLSSFSHVTILEYSSIISLFNNGYQTYLPLYKLQIPMAIPVSIGFMASVIGSILWLYLNDGKKQDNAFAPFSIVLGLVIGYIFFESLHYIPVKFEFLYIAMAVLATYIIISYSNGKGRDIFVDPGNNP